MAHLWAQLHDHHVEVALRRDDVGLRPPEEAWRRFAKAWRHWEVDAEGRILVPCDGDRTVGLAMSRLRPGHHELATGQMVGVLEVLVVDRTCRGRGIGRALVDRLTGELDKTGIHEVELGVVEGNTGAEAFYAELGFLPISTNYLRSAATWSTSCYRPIARRLAATPLAALSRILPIRVDGSPAGAAWTSGAAVPRLCRHAAHYPSLGFACDSSIISTSR